MLLWGISLRFSPRSCSPASRWPRCPGRRQRCSCIGRSAMAGRPGWPPWPQRDRGILLGACSRRGADGAAARQRGLVRRHARDRRGCPGLPGRDRMAYRAPGGGRVRRGAQADSNGVITSARRACPVAPYLLARPAPDRDDVFLAGVVRGANMSRRCSNCYPASAMAEPALTS